MATVVGTVNLNGCNYQLAYDLLGQNIAGNYSTVRLYGILNVTNNYVSWTRGSASVHTSGLQSIGTYYKKGSHTVITRDFDWGHDNNGNFSVYIGASLSTTFTSGDCGGVITLPSIPRQANVTGATDFTDETNPRITFNNPGGFRINARLEFGGTNIRRDNIPNTGSYTFNLTDSERDLLRSKCTNSNSMTVREVIGTCIGGTSETHWSWQDKKMSIVNANPIFNNFDWEVSNEISNNLTGSNKNVINGYSNIKIAVSVEDKAEAIKKATMSKYRVNIGTGSLDIGYSDNEEVVGNINNANSGTINIYAIDSRGNSTLVTKQVDNVITYNPLVKGNITLTRSDNGVGGDVTLKYDGQIDIVNFGAVINNIKSVKYTIQKSNSSEILIGETDITPNIQDGKFSFEGLIKGDTETKFDIGSSYIINVILEDELSSITYSANLGSGRPNIAIAKDGVALGQKYDVEVGGRVQLADDTIVNVGKGINMQDLVCDAYWYGKPDEDASGSPGKIEWTNLKVKKQKDITYYSSKSKYGDAYFHFNKKGLYAIEVHCHWANSSGRHFCDLNIKSGTDYASSLRTTDTQNDGSGDPSTTTTFIVPINKDNEMTISLYSSNNWTFKSVSYVKIYKICNFPS